MKNFIHKILLTTFSSLLFLSLSLKAQVSFHVSGAPTKHQIEDVPRLLENMLEENPDKDIFFYVHGRSRTLEKELRRSKQIEENYNVKVLMLHWESWSSTITRPTDNAKNAGLELSKAITYLKMFKDKHAEVFEDKKLFVLFHSMGNLILKSYVENHFNEQLNEKFFDAVILNAPDTPYKSHRDWLKKVFLSENSFVIMNKNDFVLNASKLLDINFRHMFDDRLGLGIKFYFHHEKILSPNVLYFDLTKTSGGEHAHFVSQRPEVKKIFNYILAAKSNPDKSEFIFSEPTINPIEDLDPYKVIKNVYYFKD